MTAILALLRPFLPYIITVMIAFSTGWGGAWHVQGLRLTAAHQEHTQYVQEVTQKGLAAEADKLRKEAEAEANLKKVQAYYEDNLPSIRSDAVANYEANRRSVNTKPVSVRVTAGSPGGSGLSIPAARQPVDDAAKSECVPDSAFIQAAAEDVAKLTAWQEYCALNKCPVK